MREIIRKLNHLNLDRADYQHIKRLINQLIVHVPLSVTTRSSGLQIYRGRVSSKKLEKIKDIKHPPIPSVTDYQRCNPPHQPMFYCAAGRAPIFYELNVKTGDVVYMSKWTFTEDAILLSISPDGPSESHDSRSSLVSTYFETVFSQPIHEVYSRQYKITSAIADVLTEKSFHQDADMSSNPAFKREVSLKYPSVQYPSRADCLALKPSIVDGCLKLDYVEEILIKDVNGTKIDIESQDVSSDFCDGSIRWTGMPMHWKIGPGQSVSITREQEGYVVRNKIGETLNPG